MKKKTYSIALVISSASRYFPLIRKIIKSTREHFTSDALREIQLCGWIFRDAVGVILHFNKMAFLTSVLNWLSLWIRDLHIKVVELERMQKIEREAFLTDFHFFSDIGYAGDYNLDDVLDELDDRFIEFYEDQEDQGTYHFQTEVIPS